MDFCQIKSKVNYNNLSFNQYKYYICRVNKNFFSQVYFLTIFFTLMYTGELIRYLYEYTAMYTVL